MAVSDTVSPPYVLRDARLRRLAPSAASGALLAVALLNWALALGRIDLYHLGEYGLPPELPFEWYMALGVCVVGALIHALSDRTRWAWAYLLGAAAVLFLTLPLLAEQPHYGWVYKHIGVVRFIQEYQHTEATIDIYHRWPGFFALSAAFGSVGGVPNPVKYAAWSEFAFATFNLFLLGNIVRVITGSRRTPIVAGLLFLAVNWVGQTYFAPQALAFSLHLVVLWVVITQLGEETAGPVGRAVLRLASRIVRRPQQPGLPSGHRWMPRWAAIGTVLLLHGIVVATHQLTPYMLVLEVGGLALLGLVGPRLLPVALLAMAIGYLLPNLDYVQQHFGVFSSVDPVGNAQKTTSYAFSPAPGKVFNERAGHALVVLMLAGAAISTLVLARRGVGARALLLLVLAIAPGGLILGQDYGGEAPLRVVLFCSPWCAVLVAWAFMGASMTRRRSALLGGAVAVATALFIPAYFGQEQIHSIPRGEVEASDYLYEHGRTPAGVLQASAGFPRLYGPRYAEFRGSSREDYNPSLLEFPSFRHRRLGARDIPRVIEGLEQFPRGYLVFSSTQEKYARLYRLSPPGALAGLEAAIARDRRFRRWYRGPDARIYEYVPPSSTTGRAPGACPRGTAPRREASRCSPGGPATATTPSAAERRAGFWPGPSGALLALATAVLAAIALLRAPPLLAPVEVEAPQRPRAAPGALEGAMPTRPPQAATGLDWVTGVVVGACVLVAMMGVLGFLIGSSEGPTPGPARWVTAGPLSLRLPGDWERRPPAQALPGVRLANAVAGGPRDTSSAGIVAWRVGANPDVLHPERLLPSGLNDSHAPASEVVALGRHDAYRRRGLRAGDGRLRVTTYSFPTFGGATVVACYAPPPVARRFMSECEGVASSLALRDLGAARRGTVARETRRLNAILAELARRRAIGRKRLAAARTLSSQARAARALAATFHSTRIAIDRSRAGPATGLTHTRLVRALARVESGYRRLFRAAVRRSRSRYDSARRLIVRSEADLRTLVGPPARRSRR